MPQMVDGVRARQKIMAKKRCAAHALTSRGFSIGVWAALVLLASPAFASKNLFPTPDCDRDPMLCHALIIGFVLLASVTDPKFIAMQVGLVLLWTGVLFGVVERRLPFAGNLALAFVGHAVAIALASVLVIVIHAGWSASMVIAPCVYLVVVGALIVAVWRVRLRPPPAKRPLSGRVMSAARE